jgi:hypothetical protein
MYVIGIDPGLTGAIALMGPNGLEACADIPVMMRGNGEGAVKNQVDPGALEEMLRNWISGHDKNEFMVLIESQGPVRLPGNKVLGGASAFSLAYTAGLIEGVVATLHLPREFVPPGHWKKALGLKASGPDKKALARAMAQRYYPQAELHRVKDHNRAESILIARYGYERHA